MLLQRGQLDQLSGLPTNKYVHKNRKREIYRKKKNITANMSVLFVGVKGNYITIKLVKRKKA